MAVVPASALPLFVVVVVSNFAMGIRGFLFYLLSGFSVAILSVLFINKNNNMNHNSTLLQSPNLSTADKVWPVSIFLCLRIFIYILAFNGVDLLMGFFFVARHWS